jgi:penicillin-binding protein 2
MHISLFTIKKSQLIMAIWWTVIIIRLWQLQTYDGSLYQERSLKNYLKIEKILSLRGEITDCNGIVIATNSPIITLWWQGSGSKKLTDQQQRLYNYIATFYPLPDIANIVACERLERQLLLAEDVPLATMSSIIEQFPLSKNILIKTDFKRCYPYQQTACHVIGYLGALSSTYGSSGVMGVEKLCEEPLKGDAGIKETVINSFGKRINETAIKEALQGTTIQTTLNLNYQKILEAAFDENFKGAGIIICPKTGAIRAILSRPTFDPHIFLHPISTEQWEALQVEKPFLNRAIDACYPPASLFKLVTATAALETGIITTQDSWVCRGHITYGGRDFHCMHREGHGLMSLQNALAHSCNIPFYEMGKRLSIDTIARYAHEYGLGEETGTALREKKGFIPTREWKKRALKQSWYQGENLPVAVGQGAVLVTPLQIGCMIGSIVEGSLVKPRILESEPIVIKKINIQKKTLAFLKQSMHSAIVSGTGISLSNIKNVRLYGKTGTAQTVSKIIKNSSEKSYEEKEHAWFVAYIESDTMPPLVIVIFTEHTESTGPTKRIAKKIIEDIYVKHVDLLSPSKETQITPV